MQETAKIIILDEKAIGAKLMRLAAQILEQHTDFEKIQFLGLNERGFYLANELRDLIKKFNKSLKVEVFEGLTEHEIDVKNSNAIDPNLPIIVVDDVLNTGKSMFFLLTKLAEINPQNIKICVLADRKHKKYPIRPDFVGLSFATTLQEFIIFDKANLSLYLT